MPLFVYDAGAGEWRPSTNFSPAQADAYKTSVRAWVWRESQGVWRAFLSKDWILPPDGNALEKTPPGGGAVQEYEWQDFLEGGVAEPVLRDFETTLVDGTLLIVPSAFPGLQNVLAPGDKIRFVVDREAYGSFSYLSGSAPYPFPGDHAPAVALYGWPTWLNIELEFLPDCYSIGRGGRGGRGEYLGFNFTTDEDAEPGGPGGVGLFLDNDVTLLGSSSVVIAGGGGGGGGGAAAEVRHSDPGVGTWGRAGGGGGNAGVLGQFSAGSGGGNYGGETIEPSEPGLSSVLTPGQLPSNYVTPNLPFNGGRVKVNDNQDGDKYANGGNGGSGGLPGQDGYPGRDGSTQNQFSSLGGTGEPGAGGAAGPAVIGAARILNMQDVDITFIGAVLD